MTFIKQDNTWWEDDKTDFKFQFSNPQISKKALDSWCGCTTSFSPLSLSFFLSFLLANPSFHIIIIKSFSLSPSFSFSIAHDLCPIYKYTRNNTYLPLLWFERPTINIFLIQFHKNIRNYSIRLDPYPIILLKLWNKKNLSKPLLNNCWLVY